MKEKSSEKKFFRGRLWLMALIVLILGLIFAAGGAAAKYISERRTPRNIVDTRMFYFTSDILMEKDSLTEKYPEVSVNAGTNSVSFELRNFADDLRFSELDIEYEVTVDNGAAVDYPAQAHKLSANSKNSAIISISGLENGKSYTVAATGKNGYAKTIGATFVVAPETPRVYKRLDKYDDYIVLTLWTEGNVTGDAVIAYPDGLIPDNTDPAMSDWKTGGAGTDTISFTGLYASHQYRFFTDKGASLQLSEFTTVTVGGKPAEELAA